MILTNEQRSALDEFRKRQQHKVNVYVPTNVEGHDQLAFLKSTKQYRLLFGGNQSGKSHTASYDLACYARGRHPYYECPKGDISVWVISTEYITITNGIYRHLCDMIPRWDIINEGPKVPGHRLPSYIEVRRKCGGTCNITFMSAKGENRQKFQAEAVSRFYIDEEIPGDIIEELEARTLVTGGDFVISATLVESYEWITRLERRGEKNDPLVFLTRLDATKNPYIHQERMEQLSRQWSEETKAYRLYGKSRRTTGLVYNTWKSYRNECNPFKIPHDWPRWCCIDPGIRTCAVLWVAVDPDNNAYAYRELYAHNEPLWTIAVKIREAEHYILNKELSKSFGHFVWEETEDSEHMVVRLIDDKRNSRLITGDPGVLDQLYDRYGLLCTPANKAKLPGIEEVRFWIENGFKVFNTLDNFLEERSTYRIRNRKFRKDQNDTIDEPIKRNDHLMDCWRYICREKPSYSARIMYPGARETMSTAERIQQQREKEYVHETLGEYW